MFESYRIILRKKSALTAGAGAAVAASLLLFVSFVSPPASHAQRQRRSNQTPAQPQQQQSTTARPTPTPRNNPAMTAPPAGTVIIDAAEPPPVPVDLSKPVNQEIDDDATVKIDTNLVNLNVRVIDRLNRPINDVRQDEMRVFENGVPQEVVYFSREEVPISYGLVIDNSGSLRSQIQQVVDAGKTIVSGNKLGDETFLVRFVDKDHIETVQDFTPNKAALADALDNLYVQGGQTAVRDAVYLSAEHVAEHKTGDDMDDRRRRALILITDGEDRDSYYTEDNLFARLREADVQIFVVGFVKELDKEGGFIRKSPREKAAGFLDRLAKETGGRAFFPETANELAQIAQEITRDLRTQYRVGYNPTNKARDGSYRALRVTIADAAGRDKRIAVTRPGYNAPRGEAPPAAVKPAALQRNSSAGGARRN